jgi:hypothetical protein
MGDVDAMKTISGTTGSSITSTDFCTSTPSDLLSDTYVDDCPFDDSGLVLEDRKETGGERSTSAGSSEGEKVRVSSIELQNAALPASSVDAACYSNSAGSESCQDRDNAEIFEQVSYGTVSPVGYRLM